MDKDIAKIRTEFPILKTKVNDEVLIYFDNAASSQMPLSVSRKIFDFDQNYRANVHRGLHTLGMQATNRYEKARHHVRNCINAQKDCEVIFTSGCTDSLNLVANSYGEVNIHAGDEIVVSIMEHHSNLLCWQQLAQRKHAKLRFIELDQDQKLDLADAKKKISPKTKIVAITHVSNVLGGINPLKELAKLAHQNNAIIVADGAQAVGHFEVDVQDLDVDFYAFSGHKMFGPNGIGVLYGKRSLLEKMPPYRLGGEMIENVTRTQASWADLPQKFEAGTPNISGAIGLDAAIDFIEDIGLKKMHTHDIEMRRYLLDQLKKIADLKIYGPKNDTGAISLVSFNLSGCLL